MTIIGLSDFLVERGELGLDWTGTELNDAFGFGTNPFLVLRGKVVIDNWFWFWWLWWAKMEGFCLWRVLGVKKSEGLRLISAYFGRQPIRPDSANTVWFWPNRRESKPSRHESSWVGTNMWKKKKKKSLGVALTSGQPRRTLHPALGHVGLQCGTLPTASVLHRQLLCLWWESYSYLFLL